MDGIDVAGATEALNNAGGVEHLMQQETQGLHTDQTQTPAQSQDQSQQQDTQQAQPVPAGIMRDPVTGRWVRADQQVTQQQGQQQGTENQPFTQVDPNSLPPELQSIYKSLQADYTRKTQEIAEQRRQYESLGPVEELQQAAAIYQQLQDPQSWPALHAELTEGLKALGLTHEEATQAASDAMGAQAQHQQGQADPFATLDDPELAPVKSAYEQMQQQLAELRTQFDQQQEAQRQEALQLALYGEYQRQENIILQANPHYNDEDLKAVYALSDHFGGNLLQAQQQYENIFNDRLARYMNSKQGVADQIVTLPNASALSGNQAQRPKTLEEGHAMAMEAIRQIEAAG